MRLYFRTKVTGYTPDRDRFYFTSSFKDMFLPIRLIVFGYDFIPLGWCTEDCYGYESNWLVTIMNLDIRFNYERVSERDQWMKKYNEVCGKQALGVSKEQKRFELVKAALTGVCADPNVGQVNVPWIFKQVDAVLEAMEAK